MFSQDAHRQMGRLIKKARQSSGLTQAALAKRLGYRSPQFISNWERAESLPPIHALSKIAKHTKTNYVEFKAILMKDFERTLSKSL